jgi:hypothetical protein
MIGILDGICDQQRDVGFITVGHVGNHRIYRQLSSQPTVIRAANTISHNRDQQVKSTRGPQFRDFTAIFILTTCIANNTAETCQEFSLL